MSNKKKESGRGLVLDAKGQLSGADDSVCVCVQFVLGCTCLCVHVNLFLFECVAHVSFVCVCLRAEDEAPGWEAVKATAVRSHCPHCPLVMRMPLPATVAMVTAGKAAHTLLV